MRQIETGSAYFNHTALRCNCSIDAKKLPPFKQLPFKQGYRVQDLNTHYEPSRYLFLLGWPYSGTSAVHFLLATSLSVSTLGPPGVLGPDKEGWAKSHLKNSLTARQRWNVSQPLPWQQLRTVYHSHWNLSRPILLENSPPEILHAAELNATFSPTGKVRFLLLVRSACSSGSMQSTYAVYSKITHSRSHDLYSAMGKVSRSVIDAFGEDVFVLRYEDLCLRWNETLLRITAWEPRLGDIDISRVPSAASHPKMIAHGHEQTSILKYCDAARSAWQSRIMEATGLPTSCANISQLPQSVSDTCEAAMYFGYEQIDTCA